LRLLTPTWLLFLLWVFGNAVSGHAQSSDNPSLDPAATESAWHFQFDLFQLLLEEQGLVELPELDMALNTPRDAVIVVTGVIHRQSLPWH
jgi:hypothetical protein